ncbi:murein hydrolase activator EnvC family protein [Sphingosinicella rhizophila]|uniref:Peptidoglycan DD-metalloendopeptidase family protein n=1 Tax=Sphingosinicella rhizophila TaxID=3050082 RepID=A0ABU3Q530_9SPHN|nr:peptidoglycan DD-metalloendopeptidase family protein [Sphingosinicella sp. GR2756]MDT9598174.1 peptidoglycan DD-metalloendopeptidase family protein [Sphingosinicella sp. GR2756]
MMRRFALILAATSLIGGGWALAQTRVNAGADALILAKRQAAEAARRSEQLERQAKQATNEAARARADAAALAARIEVAEADISAAEARIRIIEDLRARQRARLAEKEGPVIRLTAALQTMARRPAALALVQPGSLDDVVHVRSLLASTLPVIRARTADLRAEVEAGNQLRRQADRAVASLVSGQEELRTRRIALARLEQRQRQRSESLRQSALAESDRALAFGEEARELAALAGTREFQARLRQDLVQLPGPSLRPGTPPPSGARATSKPTYILPVKGRLIRGLGEISDAGVHARGLTFATEAGAVVIAPASGRIVYAGRFRGYGEIVIIDHGNGWMTAITNLASLDVGVGDKVRQGGEIGRAGSGSPRISVELRRNGRPFPISPLIALG